MEISPVQRMHDSDEKDSSELKKRVGNRTAFKIPEGYFDQLSIDISERIQNPRMQGSKAYYLRPVLAVLSVLIITFIIIYSPKQDGLDRKNPDTLASNLLIQSGRSNIGLWATSLRYQTNFKPNLEQLIKENNLTENDVLEYLDDENALDILYEI